MGGAANANVKADNRCTATPSRTRIARKQTEAVMLWGIMRWAKLVLYLYVAQAAIGTAIGFAIPFFQFAG
jgi:hypothetical protein